MVSKTILLGRCGKDPEVRNLNSGDKVANFSLATSKSWRSKSGEKEEKTSWHQIVVFGKLAEIVEKYVTKGSQLYLEGEISYEDYEKDGIKRQSTKIIVSQLTMLGGSGESKPSSKLQGNSGYQPDPLDDQGPLPF